MSKNKSENNQNGMILTSEVKYNENFFIFNFQYSSKNYIAINNIKDKDSLIIKDISRIVTEDLVYKKYKFYENKREIEFQLDNLGNKITFYVMELTNQNIENLILNISTKSNNKKLDIIDLYSESNIILDNGIWNTVFDKFQIKEKSLHQIYNDNIFGNSNCFFRIFKNYKIKYKKFLTVLKLELFNTHLFIYTNFSENYEKLYFENSDSIYCTYERNNPILFLNYDNNQNSGRFSKEAKNFYLDQSLSVYSEIQAGQYKILDYEVFILL